MTLEELADILNISEGYLADHFLKIQEKKKNRGILIEKRGWGSFSDYGVQFPWDKEMIWDYDDVIFFDR